MQIDVINPKKTAMSVVDMQNDFVAAGAAMETPAARAMVPKLAEGADLQSHKSIVLRKPTITIPEGANTMSESKTTKVAVSGDEQAIQQIVMAVEESWNRHDMDAFAALLTVDAEWVNPVGMWWRGQANVKRAHQAYHESFLKETSRHTESLTIQQLTPDVAIVSGTYRMGDWTRPDTGQRVSNGKDRVTYVLVKQQGRWLIVRGHITDIDQKAAPFDPVKLG
jgi:uncharacterized protein (TIGR02246 family)